MLKENTANQDHSKPTKSIFIIKRQGTANGSKKKIQDIKKYLEASKNIMYQNVWYTANIGLSKKFIVKKKKKVHFNKHLY